MKYDLRTARVGIVSLVFVAVTAISFPMQAFGRWAFAVFVIVGYFTFALAIVGCVYSLVAEHPKVVGIAGLVVALLTLLIERETLYFAEMGILLLPGYAFAYGVFVLVRRLFRPEPLSER